MGKYSEDQLFELKRSFEKIDKNKDGFISKNELGAMLKGLGADIDDEELEAMMKDSDVNGDGKINFEEFCASAMAGN